jgi:hypothetical protein
MRALEYWIADSLASLDSRNDEQVDSREENKA